MSHNLWGGGHIDFCADTASSGVSMTLSYLHNILWTSNWILTKFSWIYDRDITKSWKEFIGLPQPSGNGSGVGLTLSYLHNILWTSSWILTRFSWIYNWDITKSWKDFIGLPQPTGRGTYWFWCRSCWHWGRHRRDTFLSAQYLVNQDS